MALNNGTDPLPTSSKPVVLPLHQSSRKGGYGRLPPFAAGVAIHSLSNAPIYRERSAGFSPATIVFNVNASRDALSVTWKPQEE